MVKNQVGLKIWCLRVLWYCIIPILHSVCFEIKHCFKLHLNSVVRYLMIIHLITSDRRRTMSISTPRQTFSCRYPLWWMITLYIAAVISKICLLKTSLTLSKVINIDSIISSQHITWKTVNQKRFALIVTKSIIRGSPPEELWFGRFNFYANSLWEFWNDKPYRL